MNQFDQPFSFAFQSDFIYLNHLIFLSIINHIDLILKKVSLASYNTAHYLRIL